MKFKKDDKIYCVIDKSCWTCDGYSKYDRVLLEEQTFILKGNTERPDYDESIFRKLTKTGTCFKMKWNIGDEFIITDTDNTSLPEYYLGTLQTVTNINKFPVDIYGEHVTFSTEEAGDWYARMDCIRPLTKLERALK